MEGKKDLLLYYSLVSGDIYYIMPDEIKNLPKHQLPLLKKPSSNCKHCYGRGYAGKDLKSNIYIPCRCMQKCFDFSKTKDYVDVDKISLVKSDTDTVYQVKKDYVIPDPTTALTTV
jgi:hypothetical protein